MRRKYFVLVFAFILIAFSNNLTAQLKIGNQARTLTAPSITLLELAVDPNATIGKGFILPNVTISQRDAMTASNSGTIPGGMTIYNPNDQTMQIYSSISNRWTSFQPLGSSIKKVQNTASANNALIAGSFNGVNSVFTLSYNSNNISIDGKVNIVYNHIPLNKGTDFTVNTTTKQITFKTLIPESFNEFDLFEVEFDL